MSGITNEEKLEIIRAINECLQNPLLTLELPYDELIKYVGDGKVGRKILEAIVDLVNEKKGTDLPTAVEIAKRVYGPDPRSLVKFNAYINKRIKGYTFRDLFLKEVTVRKPYKYILRAQRFISADNKMIPISELKISLQYPIIQYVVPVAPSSIPEKEKLMHYYAPSHITIEPDRLKESLCRLHEGEVLTRLKTLPDRIYAALRTCIEDDAANYLEGAKNDIEKLISLLSVERELINILSLMRRTPEEVTLSFAKEVYDKLSKLSHLVEHNPLKLLIRENLFYYEGLYKHLLSENKKTWEEKLSLLKEARAAYQKALNNSISELVKTRAELQMNLVDFLIKTEEGFKLLQSEAEDGISMLQSSLLSLRKAIKSAVKLRDARRLEDCLWGLLYGTYKLYAYQAEKVGKPIYKECIQELESLKELVKHELGKLGLYPEKFLSVIDGCILAVRGYEIAYYAEVSASEVPQSEEGTKFMQIAQYYLEASELLRKAKTLFEELDLEATPFEDYAVRAEYDSLLMENLANFNILKGPSFSFLEKLQANEKLCTNYERMAQLAAQFKPPARELEDSCLIEAQFWKAWMYYGKACSRSISISERNELLDKAQECIERFMNSELYREYRDRIKLLQELVFTEWIYQPEKAERIADLAKRYQEIDREDNAWKKWEIAALAMKKFVEWWNKTWYGIYEDELIAQVVTAFERMQTPQAKASSLVIKGYSHLMKGLSYMVKELIDNAYQEFKDATILIKNEQYLLPDSICAGPSEEDARKNIDIMINYARACQLIFEGRYEEAYKMLKEASISAAKSLANHCWNVNIFRPLEAMVFWLHEIDDAIIVSDMWSQEDPELEVWRDLHKMALGFKKFWNEWWLKPNEGKDQAVHEASLLFEDVGNNLTKATAAMFRGLLHLDNDKYEEAISEFTYAKELIEASTYCYHYGIFLGATKEEAIQRMDLLSRFAELLSFSEEEAKKSEVIKGLQEIYEFSRKRTKESSIVWEASLYNAISATCKQKLDELTH